MIWPETVVELIFSVPTGIAMCQWRDDIRIPYLGNGMDGRNTVTLALFCIHGRREKLDVGESRILSSRLRLDTLLACACMMLPDSSM